MKATLLALGLLTALSACSEAPASEEEDSSLADFSQYSEGSDDFSAGGDWQESEEEEFDEDAAREQAEEDLQSEPYDYSYGCTVDCSGHQAGWDYQGQEGYGSYPSGHSQSFEEGRMAYDEAVDERVEEARSEWESENE